MATIEIVHVGDNADLSALKRNFANLLQRTFNPEPKPMTFTEAIAKRGIDEKHQIRLARRRDRYSLDPRHSDRPKTFAKDRTAPGTYFCREYTARDAERDLATIQQTTSTDDYVAAWCRLNHLKETRPCA